MKWTRTPTGDYRAGPYFVNRATQPAPGAWVAVGPRCYSHHPTKAEAQAAAYTAARERIGGKGDTCEAVHGDVVLFWGGRKGIMQTAMKTTDDAERQLYCLRLPRGKRICLFRSEFEVVMP